MRITVLTENTTSREDLIAEHGLSLYIEIGEKRILFDCGQTDAFLHNAQKLGIDLRTVDMLILSHGHYDHGGGLEAFMAINSHAPIYLSRHAFGAHYNGTEKYIGLDVRLSTSERLIFTDDTYPLADGLTLCSLNDLALPLPIKSDGLTVRNASGFQPEQFLHEQVLLIERQGMRIVISGCSHKGLLNLLSLYSPNVFVGGFHFMKLNPTNADSHLLKDIAETMRLQNTSYYTCHCTGEAPFHFLKQTLGERLAYIRTGDTLYFSL